MVGRIVVWAGLLAMVLVAACGDDDADTETQPPATTQAATATTETVQALQPGPVTSFEDIAGTYLRGPGHGPIYFQFSEDGTWHASSNRDLVEDRPQSIMETRFEGTKVFLKETKSTGCGDDLEAIYEIHLLENGNLQLVAIEDKCLHRSGDFETEWAPVP